MKLNHKISISLLEFFKTGKFDFLKPGQDMEWVKNNFPDCEYIYETKTGAIWYYGNIELHFFNPDKKLWLIFSDYIKTLSGGEHLIIDKWILEKPEELTLLNVMSHLNKEGIDYEKKTYSYGRKAKYLKLIPSSVNYNFETIRLKLIPSGVVLNFEFEDKTDENGNDIPQEHDLNMFMLGAFSLSLE